jgi:hypothetical protein
MSAMLHDPGYEMVCLRVNEQVGRIEVDGELDVPGLQSLEYDSHPLLVAVDVEVRHEVYLRTVEWLLTRVNST